MKFNWRKPLLSGVTLGLVLVWNCAGAVLAEESASPESARISIVHVNDMHGYIDPVHDGKVSTDSKVGGYAWMKTLIRDLRGRDPHHTLVLNAGDLAEGTMLSYLSRGKSVTEAMGTFQFDATALGNHDFAWGRQALDVMMKGMACPVLAGNIINTRDGSLLEGSQAYIIKDLGGVKVGILGLDTPNIRHFVAKKKLQGLEFRDSAETVKWYIPLMRKGGADIIVVLSHIGYENDIRLAEAVEGIDVIVGGHSHTKLEHGDYVNGTVIVQAGAQTKYVGYLNLDLARDKAGAWTIVNYKSELLPVLSDRIKPDAEVEAILAPYREELQKVGSQPMGEAEEELLYAHREAAKLNQIHADSLWKLTGTQFGICNSRSLRSHVKAGKVTYQDLYLALPFTEENYVTMYVKGSDILGEIEDDLRDKATELAVPAGLKYTYDSTLPEGHRVVSCLLADGTKLDPDKEYFIFSNETMSRKPFFKNAREKKVYGPVQKPFFEYFTKGSPWKNNPDDRVVRLK